MRYILPILALVAVFSMPTSPKATGCAAAPHRGEFIDVNAEEAIILYDTKTKTEHFIRRAQFQTAATDFGFLVPTPSKPEIGEASSAVFQTLHTATLPRRVESGNVKRIVMKRNEPQSAARMAGNAAPEILGKGESAGYAYVILRAEDVDGLKKWLEENKYDSRPELVEWLKWYVENKWIITAFKVLQDPQAQHDRWAKSVRMSFPTDKPFYPYREPADMQKKAPGQRTLRVFYLGDSRVDGKLGTDGVWPGRIAWTNELPGQTVGSVIDGLGMSKEAIEKLKAEKWRLSEFEDQSSPRPGTQEVYFTKSEDQATVERPVILYDRYEYVYEDQIPASEAVRENLWIAIGGLSALVGAIVVVGVVLMRKKGA